MDVVYHHEISGVSEDNVVLSGKYGNLLVSGILNGSAIVKGPAMIDVQGIMNGDLIVEEGATAEIRGILNARSILCSGRLDIYGIVTSANGIPDSAVLHSGCVVNGVKH